MMQKNTKGACTLHNIVEYTKPNLFIYKENISSLSSIEAELLVSLIHLATLKGKYTTDMYLLILHCTNAQPFNAVESTKSTNTVEIDRAMMRIYSFL